MMETFGFGASGRNKIIVMSQWRWSICFLLLLSACSNSIERENIRQPSPTIKNVGSERTEVPTITPAVFLSPVVSTLSPTSSPTPASIDQAPTKPPVITKSPDEFAQISVENVNALFQYHVIEFSPWELVTTVAWSPNGKYLAVGAGNNIYIFDVEKWERQSVHQIYKDRKSVV